MSEFAITTQDLSRRFGKITAVDNLSLAVPRGSIYGFLGPNGAGKTTTIRLLLGLAAPDRGHVQLLGMPLRGHRTRLMRQVGSLVEQPSYYPHLTGRENMEVICRLTGTTVIAARRALATVGLEDAAERRVGHYSQGMRQRLGLAMAIMDDPELLILDEPTNGLDPAGIHEMREFIRKLAHERGITVFLSSHLLSEIEQLATHIGIIQQGGLRFQGTLTRLHAQMTQHVAIGTDRPEVARNVLTAAGWQVNGNGDGRLAVPANGESDAAMINGQLVNAGVNVYRLQLEQPSLEDIFLHLTDKPGNSLPRKE